MLREYIDDLEKRANYRQEQDILKQRIGMLEYKINEILNVLVQKR